MQARPQREEQALQEVGRTEISPVVGASLVVVFLLTVWIVPILQNFTQDIKDTAGAAEVARTLAPDVVRAVREEGLLAANRELLAGIERFEGAFEDDFLLRAWVLPPTQNILTASLGVGNEEAYLGRDGWLFYRDDFDHVTGPGFLETRVLRRESQKGERAADPLPAILAFHLDLAARGIELVIMPTPVKPTVHPEFLTARADGETLFHNASYAVFVGRLEAAGISVFDPSIALVAAKADAGEPLYLRTDTHWTPRAMELTAHELAVFLDGLVDWRQNRSGGLVKRTATIEGNGDIARMLRLPEPSHFFPPERVEISPVLYKDGRPWRSSREAEILLLGDSFTNVYSDPALDWGSGSGLAEHLSFELGRPVDRIALNAGGSWTSRQALTRGLRETVGATDRLAAKRVVVYQFAARELSSGNWKILPLP